MTISSGSRHRPTSAIPATTGFGNENDGRVGKRGGSYRALNAKYELGHTFAPDWWVAASLFASHNHARDVPGLTDVNRIAFDGLSFEIERRIVKRTPAILSRSQSRWSRDGRVSMSVSGLAGSFHQRRVQAFVDAVVVPDKVFWGSNVSGLPRGPRIQWTAASGYPSSGIALSSASPIRCRRSSLWGRRSAISAIFSTIFPTQEVGHAVYVGPTLLWKVTDKVAFNTTFQPQIAGRSTSNPAASARSRQF